MNVSYLDIQLRESYCGTGLGDGYRARCNRQAWDDMAHGLYRSVCHLMDDDDEGAIVLLMAALHVLEEEGLSGTTPRAQNSVAGHLLDLLRAVAPGYFPRSEDRNGQPVPPEQA